MVEELLGVSGLQGVWRGVVHGYPGSRFRDFRFWGLGFRDKGCHEKGYQKGCYTGFRGLECLGLCGWWGFGGPEVQGSP